MENLLKQPSWLRGLEVLTGLVTLVLGILVLIYPDWGVSTLVFLLSFGLIFVGIRSISLAGYGSLPTGLRVVCIIAGVFSLITALSVLVYPSYGVLTLLYLVSLGLLAYGFGRIYVAYTLKNAVGWLRGMIVAVGVVDIILSVLVLVLPGLALLTLTVILAVVLVVSGGEMIVSGAVGRTWLGNLVKAAEDEIEGK